MSNVLAAARATIEGALPAAICTTDAEGVPNVSYISRLVYVDETHVALTNQFFRKTKANLEANPHAVALILSPQDGRQYRLGIELEQIASDGEVFERLRLEVEAIASMTGMTEVFGLRSAMIFRVHTCDALPLPGEAT